MKRLSGFSLRSSGEEEGEGQFGGWARGGASWVVRSRCVEIVMYYGVLEMEIYHYFNIPKYIYI